MMMPVPSSDSGGKRPVYAKGGTASSGGGNSSSGVPNWEESVGRGSPKNHAITVPASVRSEPTAGSSGVVVSQQTKSPSVTTHQPYRGVPLSMFGVESELEVYAGINTENLVTVKPAYKTGMSCASVPSATGASGLLARRSSQRSPIAALDNSEARVGQIGRLGGGISGNGNGVATSTTPQGMASRNGFVAYSVARAAPSRMPFNNNNNKRVVSLDQGSQYGIGTNVGDGGNGGTQMGDVYRCPVAMRIVEEEEKHLNYTGVELLQSERNNGETAERARRLQQRQRQVQYGKETAGYSNYTRAIPSRLDREFRNPMHPVTPRPEYDCSKRTFDRYLNIWRRQLHLWDEYDPNNLTSQYTRIGIPTLGRLGLELPSSTPIGQQSALLSLTPMATQVGTTACTPVMFRYGRRDTSMSVGPYQRPAAYQQDMNATASPGGGVPVSGPHARPSSGCGGGSWSINNTPHTPYHGSTHSNSSYPPPLLSVLAQPTIYSPHWVDSPRQGSPNPHGGQRNSCYACHSSGGMAAAAAAAAGSGVMGGSGPAPLTNPGGGAYWDGNVYPNSSGYGYRSHGSPYGGHRYTPHSTPNQYHHHHNSNAGCGNLTTSPPMCVNQEGWGAPQRQMYQ